MSTADLANLVSRLEVAVQQLEKKSGGSGGAGGDGGGALPQFIDDYDAFVSQCVDPYVKAAGDIGDAVAEQAKILKTMTGQLRNFLVVVAKYSAPKDQAVLGKLVEPMGKNIGEIESFKNKLDRKSNLINHVRAASEGVMMFIWVTIPKTPMKQVKDSKETAMFYTNKVLTGFKSSADAAKHKAWVETYLAIFEGMRDYIKEHHTTGPSWNSSGSPATADAAQSGGPPPPPGAPAPPPPPPASAAPPPQPAAASSGSVSALLQDINKGADVTKGLKKVTNDMKTHKNPELRKHHVPVPYKPTPTAYKPMSKAATKAPAKPPKLALEGKKWVVEFQEKATLTLDQCEMKQTAYIYKCNNCTITVSNKLNSIIMDTCKKTGLVFSSVVSGVEIINCQSVQLQAQGQMHSVSIDKTDGCIVYLSKECINANIVTAKSSEMNVSIPKDDGDFDEYPIVEQFRSTWDAKKKALITVPSEQLG